MGIYEFRQLVSGFCKDASLQDSSAIASGKAFLIHQCLVWLQYIDVSNLCRVVIDLGMPADGIPANMARTMLESNCASHSRYLPFLGINETDGHALLMLHIPLSMLRNEVKLFFLLDQQLLPLIKAWQNCFETVDGRRRLLMERCQTADSLEERYESCLPMQDREVIGLDARIQVKVPIARDRKQKPG
jgi:hypothetical protein